MADSTIELVQAADIQRARERIQGFVHRTPLLTNASLDEIASNVLREKLLKHGQGHPTLDPAKVHVRLHLAFKAEHLQKGGAFKARGASNAVLTHLHREREAAGANCDPKKIWFVTHSSGNHAGALARAAQAAGASAAVVMPLSTPAPKQAAVRGYGARAIMCESTLAARESTARAVMRDLETEVGADGRVIFVHPYDDPLVIAGQGTLGEIVEQGQALVRDGWGRAPPQEGVSKPAHGKCSAASERKAGAGSSTSTSTASDSGSDAPPPFDLVISPLGGGGQLSGLSTAVKAADPRIRVYGAEPEEADDAARSLAQDSLQPAISPPRSIADGLLTALSPRTYAHIKQHVSGILTSSETHILRALQLTWERTKQLVEPSACVGLACVLQCKEDWVEAVAGVVRDRLLAGADACSALDGQPQVVDVKVAIVWTGGNVEMAKIVQRLAELGPLGGADSPTSSSS
ncbi:hypothetical protein OC842_003696 [Tilletia horrida]|uniref:Tryptophan synthase beta chain-like PALP domain-containing protein n=1 Tax=Tilletia horrida TaxID=155126 RepID=A0AAN6GBA3_9BASI|nr:hypothetical protein OC842_003696 [Tilletia horrida]